MDIPELIELIQTHLPDELTDEQIEAIHAKLVGNAGVQQALFAELSAGQTARPASFDELITRIDDLAAGGRGKRSAMWPVTILLLIAAGAGIALVLRSRLKPATPPPHTTTTLPAGRQGAATQASTRPTSRPAVKDPLGPDEPGNQLTGEPQTRPADITLPAAFPLAWNDYALLGSNEESDWRGQLPKLLRPRGGAKEPKLSGDRKYVQLQGEYRLGLLPARGRLLRLDFKSSHDCVLEFWNANSKVRITIDRKNARIAMESIARKDFKSAPAVIDSVDDHYRWQSYRCYSVDIRHQDGRMMVCRGEVPLLSTPMDKPPVEGKLICSSNLQLNLVEARVVAPLALPDNKIGPPSIHKTNAAAFEWKLEPSDKKPEELELAVDKTGGKVSLVNKIDNISAKASFKVDVPSSAGVEVTVHVTEFCPLTTFRISSSLGSDYIQSEARGDRYVLHTSDKKKKEQALARGQTVGKEFWIRFRAAGDLWAVWISPDSKRWWRRRSGQSTNKLEHLTFAIEIPQAKVKGKGPRRTAVGDVTVRRFEAFAKLADPKLVAKAKEAITDEMLKAYPIPQIQASLSGIAAPKASQREWMMACNTVLFARATHWGVRCHAIRELLADAIERGDEGDMPKIMGAINELSEIAWQTSDLGLIQHKAFEALARNRLETGRREAIEEIVNASYMSPIGRTRSLVAAPGLLRLYLQDLMTRGQWKSVRREARRAIYHAGSTDSWEDRHFLAFTKWALSEADARLADKSNPGTPGSRAAWRHPLVVNDDREMLNMLGEFLFLVEGKHYQPACKTITGRTLGDALVSLGDEEDLLQSSHFRVREIIRNTPELRKVLNRDYSEIGTIRLERARGQNDLAALKSLAVQFYGTEPGFGAMHVLADRDLSNGNFWGAAARYKLLAAEENYARRPDAQAKLRLSWAMLGRLVGKPADKPVALPGETFSAKEFEQMIASLVANRKSARPAGASKILAGPEPHGRSAKLTFLTDMPGARISTNDAAARPAMFAFDRERLIISFVNKLFAVDPNTRKIAWSHEPDPKQRGGHRSGHKKSPGALVVRPLLLGDKLYVRYGLEGRPLTCINAKTGQFLWSKRYDDSVLSDPVLIGSWVSVITAGDGTVASLRLHSVSPETGESSLSSELLRIRDQWPAIGRPAVVGNSVLFRTEGCLVNCDVRGAVRWAMRLPFVPPATLPETHARTALDDIIVHDGKVIFSLPSCPYVMCVSVDSGKTIWSFMASASTRVLGLHAGSVIVVESGRICALAPETGKLRWQRRRTGAPASVFPSARDTLVSVHLAKPNTQESKHMALGGRLVRWISSKDGQTVKELPIAGDPSIYNVLQISSDGKRIFGLAGDRPNKQDPPRIFMVEIEN